MLDNRRDKVVLVMVERGRRVVDGFKGRGGETLAVTDPPLLSLLERREGGSWNRDCG